MGDPEEPREIPEWRKLVAEVIGTFILTFVDAGGAMVQALYPDQVSPAGRAAAAGLTILAMIYTFGEISGAHLNPAVTFAFSLRGAFPWRRLPGYWIAELGGATLAALALRALLGDVEHLGMTLPKMGAGVGLAAEVFLTFLLVSVILGTSKQKPALGKSAAFAIGGVVALSGLFSRPLSGASMNPARSFGPALVGGLLDRFGIYAVGPALGAALAVVATRLVHGPCDAHHEKKAATGDGA